MRDESKLFGKILTVYTSVCPFSDFRFQISDFRFQISTMAQQVCVCMCVCVCVCDGDDTPPLAAGRFTTILCLWLADECCLLRSSQRPNHPARGSPGQGMIRLPWIITLAALVARLGAEKHSPTAFAAGELRRVCVCVCICTVSEILKSEI